MQFIVPENFFWTLKWYTDRKFFGDGGGVGEVAEINLLRKKEVGSRRAQSEKSGKFLSAPLIFSFPYAHGETVDIYIFYNIIMSAAMSASEVHMFD